VTRARRRAGRRDAAARWPLADGGGCHSRLSGLMTSFLAVPAAGLALTPPVNDMMWPPRPGGGRPLRCGRARAQ